MTEQEEADNDKHVVANSDCVNALPWEATVTVYVIEQNMCERKKRCD